LYGNGPQFNPLVFSRNLRKPLRYN